MTEDRVILGLLTVFVVGAPIVAAFLPSAALGPVGVVWLFALVTLVMRARSPR